jgi:hypothetical protein
MVSATVKNPGSNDQVFLEQNKIVSRFYITPARNAIARLPRESLASGQATLSLLRRKASIHPSPQDFSELNRVAAGNSKLNLKK